MKDARIIIGRGCGSSYSSSFGGLEAEMGKEHLKMKLEDIGKQLAKQAKINDGEIIIFNIGFNFKKRGE